MPIILQFERNEGKSLKDYLVARGIQESEIKKIEYLEIYSLWNGLDDSKHIYFKIDSGSVELQIPLSENEKKMQETWIASSKLNKDDWKPSSLTGVDAELTRSLEGLTSKIELSHQKEYENNQQYYSSVTPKTKNEWDRASRQFMEPLKNESIILDSSQKNSQGTLIVVELRKRGFSAQEICRNEKTMQINLEHSGNLCYYRTFKEFTDPGRYEVFSFYKQNEKVFEIKVFKDSIEYTNLLNPSQERLKRRGFHFNSTVKELNSTLMTKVKEDKAFREVLLNSVISQLDQYQQKLQVRKEGPLEMFKAKVRTKKSKESVIDAIKDIKNGKELKLTQEMADIVYYGTEEKKALENAFATLVNIYQVPLISKSREILEILQEVSRFAEIDYPQEPILANS